jgi:hypothetical protein
MIFFLYFVLLSSCVFVVAGYNVTFIHPKSAGGVLVELVQAPADVIAAADKK